MIRETNQKAAGGAVLRTGRRAEEAGHSENSYQELASNLGPGQVKEKAFNRNFEISYIYQLQMP